MRRPRVLIVRAPGTNCDKETEFAFEQAGGAPVPVHINRLLENPNLPLEFEILCIPGGFSYGDDIAAGRILANQIRHHLAEALGEFRDAGKLILGICNGFQILLEAGLLPGAMLRNRSLRFICRDVHVRVESGATPFTRNLKDRTLRIPIAHMEGNYFTDPETLSRLEAEDRIVFRYAGPDGRVTEEANPNGSLFNIAGICNEDRNVLGMMPHPERACEDSIGGADGRLLLESLIQGFTSKS